MSFPQKYCSSDSSSAFWWQQRHLTNILRFEEANFLSGDKKIRQFFAEDPHTTHTYNARNGGTVWSSQQEVEGYNRKWACLSQEKTVNLKHAWITIFYRADCSFTAAYTALPYKDSLTHTTSFSFIWALFVLTQRRWVPLHLPLLTAALAAMLA